MRKLIYRANEDKNIVARTIEEKKFFQNKGYTFSDDFEEVKDEKEEYFRKIREKREKALKEKRG